MKLEQLPASELRLGDVVKLQEGPWGTAIVKQIKDDSVVFFRPYGTSADFEYTGGVICYIGLEEFSRPITDKALFTVYERKDLKGSPIPAFDRK